MARTALPPQRVTSSGLDPVPEPANIDGHSIPLRPGLVVLVANAGTTAVTVTIPTPVTVDGLAVADRTISVPAGASRFLIALGGDNAYRQSDGLAYLNFSDTTSVQVALIQL